MTTFDCSRLLINALNNTGENGTNFKKNRNWLATLTNKTLLLIKHELGVVVHTYNLSIVRAGEGGSPKNSVSA